MSNGLYLCVGEALCDVYSDFEAIAGAPLNVAVHLRRRGYATRLLSCIGADDRGKKIQAFVKQEDLPPIALHSQLPTGTARITQRDGQNTFKIDSSAAWSEIPYPENATTADVIYFGSLAMEGAHNRDVLEHLRKHNSKATFVCDLNLRSTHYDEALINWCLDLSEVLKISDEELEILQKSYPTLPREPFSFLRSLCDHKDIRFIACTLGADGAMAVRQGDDTEYGAPSPEMNKDDIVDTVGAGDAFTSVLLENLEAGRNLGDVLKKANQFAAEICRTKGAIPPGS